MKESLTIPPLLTSLPFFRLTPQTTLTEISKGFEYMKSGECLRCVVDMSK